MARATIIAGNWKMHGSRTQTEAILSELTANLPDSNHLQWLVLPPFVYLDQTQRLLQDTPVQWGAQNLSTYTEGAYTGEISASMLLDFGCHYVLTGHSERRHLFNEDDDTVAAKTVTAQQTGLIPILCVGETQQQRQSNATESVIRAQLDAFLDKTEDKQAMNHLIIAYEPVWAIGTGQTATPKQAQEVHRFIREHIKNKLNNTVADNLQILYGGSVKPDNAQDLLQQTDIDGCLVGGASLDPEKFIRIGLCSPSS